MTEKRDPNNVPPHMRGDEALRNENIDAGRTLCRPCGGTGNAVLSMYTMCLCCDGTGHHGTADCKDLPATKWEQEEAALRAKGVEPGRKAMKGAGDEDRNQAI